MVYKVEVKTAGDREWVSNMQRFGTEEGAMAYGRDLAGRWTAVREWRVVAVEEGA